MTKKQKEVIQFIEKQEPPVLVSSVFVIIVALLVWTIFALNQKTIGAVLQGAKTRSQLQAIQTKLTTLQNEDQYKKNKELEAEIDNIHTGYKSASEIYEQIQDLRAEKKDTSKLDPIFTQALADLSSLNYASAESELKNVSTQIAILNAPPPDSSGTSAAPATASNAPPASGFSRQSVTTDVGTFTVDIIAADLNSTRVIVDTASDSDCSNNCPVLPLADYVARNGAFAGINGTFFCPADYPSCTGKTNSFDTLLMNKNKHYFNSDNNKYSTVPLVYFSGNSMGLRERTEDWGRDTGVDSVIAMQPLLVEGGNVVYGGSTDPKFGSRGARGFIGNKGSTVYIGDVLGATMGEGAHVLKTLGLENAINLDEGGSTALWDGGYILGPGRNLPNVVLFVRK